MKSLLLYFVIIAFSILLFSGCATYKSNPRLEKADFLESKRLATFTTKDRSDELFLFLSFSGGGTRAAAMSYGMLEALAKVDIPKKNNNGKPNHSNHSLLEEVDVISSVSGGSFTAAYYGLHGKKAFEDYKERFLYRRVQSALLWRIFNPLRWPKLFSPGYTRSNLTGDYYDKILFDGKTFGDLFQSGGPAIYIQATDIIDGYNFSFTPYSFNLICSSLSDFSVSQAVAASSAYPGAFSGITLTNYAGQCDYQSEPWVYEAIEEKDPMDTLYLYAKRELLYTDSEDKKYVHLFDGGVSDNLGLEGPLIHLAQFSQRGISFKELGLGNTKRAVFLIVNAQTGKGKYFNTLSLKSSPPRTRKSVSAALTTIMNNSNFHTIYMFQNFFKERRLKMQLAGEDIPEIDYYIIHITFDDITDEDERDFFEDLPTSLQLPVEQVDRIRDKAGELLFQSEDFKKFIEDLGGKIPAN